MQNDEQRVTSYVRKVQEDSRQLTQDLLGENEKLRGIVSSLQEEKLSLDSQLRLLQGELDRHQKERTHLQQQLADIHEESLKLFERYTEVEQQSGNLSNLYVASYRLHATLDRQEVIAVIEEIIINLVGCEELAIFEMSPDGETLSLVSSFGIDPTDYRVISMGEGLIGEAALKGEMRIVADGETPLEKNLTACVPLKVEGKVTGIIAIFRLLPQKTGLETIDYELFDLLATHAAMALYCCGLHRKPVEEFQSIA
jgi:hypothetical protein